MARHSKLAGGTKVAAGFAILALAFVVILSTLTGGHNLIHMKPKAYSAEKDAAKDPSNPEFLAWYADSHDAPHVIVWRDGKAMKEGITLIAEGTAHSNPQLVHSLIACMVDRGTKVGNVDGSFFSSSILVEEGPWEGCRGVVSNNSLSKTRPAAARERRRGYFWGAPWLRLA